jgi:uncharacterized membrane protein
MNRWQEHPGVTTGRDLPLGARAADLMRNGMGSWAFVLVFTFGLAVWMYFKGPAGIDPFPFILLNLILSCIAALQGAIILIAQKRSDQVAAEEAHYTLQNTVEIKQQIEELREALNGTSCQRRIRKEDIPRTRR